MWKEELEKHLKVNTKGIIESPGKYEGEPLWVAYLWETGDWDNYDEGAGLFQYDIKDFDILEFPELARYTQVSLVKSIDGFVSLSSTKEVQP